ncbi:uncharacterized protein SOCE26_067070 [Sorangium cellulosum]|uniref:Uncharacterized protein n=1 Tax=Sorangium cellulosum TaxID=56 RepID=A0A2L0F118_SORCE|nr:uncharacterized protein SOCE26_067070 [Sorangium cellulosum]
MQIRVILAQPLGRRVRRTKVRRSEPNDVAAPLSARAPCRQARSRARGRSAPRRGRARPGGRRRPRARAALLRGEEDLLPRCEPPSSPRRVPPRSRRRGGAPPSSPRAPRRLCAQPGHVDGGRQGRAIPDPTKSTRLRRGTRRSSPRPWTPRPCPHPAPPRSRAPAGSAGSRGTWPHRKSVLAERPGELPLHGALKARDAAGGEQEPAAVLRADRREQRAIGDQGLEHLQAGVELGGGERPACTDGFALGAHRSGGASHAGALPRTGAPGPRPGEALDSASRLRFYPQGSSGTREELDRRGALAWPAGSSRNPYLLQQRTVQLTEGHVT